MIAASVIVPAQLAYLFIPARELQAFVDGLFPWLAKFPPADSVAGGSHRYVAGHDLMLNVLKTFKEHGVVDGIRHAGHIILTDFPTKAGIPIPGFSKSGLGQWLEQAGISHGWLNVNICEAGVSTIAIAEGTPDLMLAIEGSLHLDAGTLFDTFVEGGIEVALAVATENPVLLAGGIENILAGLVSVWNTYSIYIDPLTFWGSTFTSAILGFIMSACILRQPLAGSAISAIRGGIVGGLFAVSVAFGFGALAGFVVYSLGSRLACIHMKSQQALLSIDRQSYDLLIEELCKGNADLAQFIEAATPRLVFLDTPALLVSEYKRMARNIAPLPSDPNVMAEQYQRFRVNLPGVFDTEVGTFCINYP